MITDEKFANACARRFAIEHFCVNVDNISITRTVRVNNSLISASSYSVEFSIKHRSGKYSDHQVAVDALTRKVTLIY